MSVETGLLAEFQPVLDELVAARAQTDQFGHHRSSGNSREDRLNDFNYEDAKAAEAVVAKKLVNVINDDESSLTGPQKAIAIKVLDHTWRAPMDEAMIKISDGFSAFERVRQDAELNRGLVARIGDSSISLFISKGEDDIVLTPPPHFAPGHHGLMLQVTNGIKVLYGAETSRVRRGTQTIAPFQLTVTSDQHADYILGHGAGDNVAEDMRKFDPESGHYKQPFVRLGTKERPNADLDAVLTESVAPKPALRMSNSQDLIRAMRQRGETKKQFSLDHKRYAARLAILSLGQVEWVHVSAPGDSFRDDATEYFATKYANLLSGHTQVGKLINLDRQTRTNVMHAAGTDKDSIETATRELLKRRANSQDSALGIVQSLQTKYSVDAFFDSI